MSFVGWVFIEVLGFEGVGLVPACFGSLNVEVGLRGLYYTVLTIALSRVGLGVSALLSFLVAVVGVLSTVILVLELCCWRSSGVSIVS